MTPRDGRGIPRMPRGLAWGIVGVAAGLVIAAGLGLALTSRSGFLAQYRSLERTYTTLQTSAHSGVPCDQCHSDSRGVLVDGAARVGDFYRGLVRRPDEPVFVKLPKPSNAACLVCHREDWSDDASRTAKIPHPAHLRVADETRECVACHKWTAHEESYIEKHKQMPFSSVCASFECHVGTKRTAECFSCHHVLHEDGSKWRVDHPATVRAKGPNGCLEKCHEAAQCRTCHTTGKRPDFGSTLATAGVRAIELQHVKPDWIDAHGTLAMKDRSKCLVCHVSLAECGDCHARRPAFHGPKATWLNRHKEFAGVTKGGKTTEDPAKVQRCLTCHKRPWCDQCHKQFQEMR